MRQTPGTTNKKCCHLFFLRHRSQAEKIDETPQFQPLSYVFLRGLQQGTVEKACVFLIGTGLPGTILRFGVCGTLWDKCPSWVVYIDPHLKDMDIRAIYCETAE